MVRRGLLTIAAATAIALLAACQPIQPAPQSMPGANGGGLPPGPAEPAAIVLPDGTECLWAGMGATMAFDGERLNYTCGMSDAGETVLLGDIVQDEETVWTVTKGLVTHGDDGFSLAESEPVTFFLAQLDLSDGDTCLHAGFGATFGYDDKRANWTCNEQEGKIVAVLGPLLPGDADEPGAYYADKWVGTMTVDKGFVGQTEFMVPVVKIVGQERNQ